MLRFLPHLLTTAVVVSCMACTTAPTTQADPLALTYQSAASIDAAIKAADIAVNAGTLKGQPATNTIRALGTAKAAVQAAIAAQVAGAKP